MDIKKTIETLQIDVDSIADQSIRLIISQLLNIIESQADEIKRVRTENQRLRDENNQLKGEQGKPKFRKQSGNNNDVSSEQERNEGNRKPPRGKKAKKKKRLPIHKTQRCDIAPPELPSDAIFKGYESTVVQDITISPNNIEFKRAIYYSPSQGKSFLAPLPDGYQGDFGPNIKALVLDLHHDKGMTGSAIHGFLTTQGVDISTASISRLLTDNHEFFHDEKQSIVSAGLQSSDHQQMDDTGARVKGKNHYTHILCNDHYTAYFTRQTKDRLTILTILTQGELTFHFNENTYALLEQMKVSTKMLTALKAANPSPVMNRAEVDALLASLLPMMTKQHKNRQLILEASAIIGYQSRPDAIKILLTDDAPQFKRITDLLALCWVHDGRHYKKLSPVVPWHRKKLKDFLKRYWAYYRELLAYKCEPSEQRAIQLTNMFEQLFSTVTGYDALDERIKKTQAKQASLLLVLRYPEIPLHNNTSELGARKQARYRDISFHTMSEKGTEAKDTFMTILQTAKKLGVNTFDYLRGRLTNDAQTTPLPELILAQV